MGQQMEHRDEKYRHQKYRDWESHLPFPLTSTRSEFTPTSSRESGKTGAAFESHSRT